MGRRLYPLLLAVILAVGCGGDEGGGSDGGESDAVATCKQSVDAAQGISNDAKEELRDLCEEAGNADEAKAREASQKVCSRIVEETIPAGPARDAGVQACKQTNQ
jgi:hypothetical protein